MKLHHFSLIFLIISLSFLLLISIKTRTYKHVINEKRHLDQALSEAADKAILTYIEEQASGDIKVNKERLVRGFLDNLYASLNIDNPSEKEGLDFYIPIILVTTMDGFYVYYTDEYKVSSGNYVYKKQWSEKYPFYHEDDDFIYTFSLSDILTLYDKKGLLGLASGQRMLTLDVNDFIYLEEFEDFRILRPNSFLLSSTRFYEVRKSIITSSLEKALANYTNRHNELSKKLGLSYQFHLPSTSGELSKAIEAPGLIAIMQGYPLTTNKDMAYNRIHISSSQLVKKQLYILEEKDGIGVFHKNGCTDLIGREIDNSKSYYSISEHIKEGAYPCHTCINE
ncbi:MAG: hypothetical protein GX323_07085 [Clostridiales bacterium]|nr:hypothetical protein [Clostridiales bacterium]